MHINFPINLNAAIRRSMSAILACNNAHPVIPGAPAFGIIILYILFPPAQAHSVLVAKNIDYMEDKPLLPFPMKPSPTAPITNLLGNTIRLDLMEQRPD